MKSARVSLRLSIVIVGASLLLSGSPSFAAHAVALFGQPKYRPDYTHFDYAKPDAPKGGEINLSVVLADSNFDKYNPFTVRGKAAPGLMELLFETLTVYSLDEPNTQYGLLASDIDVAQDFGSVTIRVDPRARFSNGDPVTAADVKYSFDTLVGPKASPVFRSYFSDIRSPVIVDPLTVRFTFKRKGRDLSFIAGSLPVFSPKWAKTADGKPMEFDQLRLQTPIASGPYTVSRSDSGQTVFYTRNPDYWARDLPIRRGSYNFDRVIYKLYKDADTQVAAMRAGDFDFFSETRMRYWCCQFIGKRFDSGELIKQKFPHRNPRPMNGYVFNLRRERFADVRVREALDLIFDWDWVNRMIFDDEFTRQDSYFANTSLAASGLPGPDELKLLEPVRGQIEPAVFGPMVEEPTTRPPSSLRRNLARATELLAAAGWHNVDGTLRNAQGEPFMMEMPRSNTLFDSYFYNLSKVGIALRARPVDPVNDRQRQRRFDFDTASIALRDSRMPGPELLRNFDSKAADVPGSENLAGLKSPAVDSLLRALLDAGSDQEQQAAARALDRVLMHGHYVLPYRYLKNHYFIFHRRLEHPDVVPLYYGAYEWVLGQWWNGKAVQKR